MEVDFHIIFWEQATLVKHHFIVKDESQGM